MTFLRIVIPFYLLFEHDLRANASRLSRGKTGTHFSGSCSSGANSLSGESELSGGRGDRFARVGANALDHGAQAVGALRRQVLAKSEFVEHRDGVGGKNLLRRVAGIKCQQDCDQSAHDMRVAVAEIVQHWCVAVAAVDLLGKPDLAGAA